MTDEDYEGIAKRLRNGQLTPLFARQVSERELFRQLKVDDEKLQRFSYSLEKRADGRCEFLGEDTRCLLHRHFGEEAKPAMCRLFPYTFTTTPSGVYASVSFSSSGVLFNFGRPLAEQADTLMGQWNLFQKLFPSLHLDWSHIQLADGIPLTWDCYLKIESQILPGIKAMFSSDEQPDKSIPETKKRVDVELLALAGKAREELPKGSEINLDKIPDISCRPKTVDQLLVKELMTLYFPDDVFSSNECDLDAMNLTRQLIDPPAKVELKTGGKTVGFDQIYNFRLGKLPDEIEQLLARYVYCRIFSKLYFGPGLGYLSLLAGIHHLIVLVSLVRMKLKIDFLTLKEGPRLERAAELVREMERRLTVVNLSRESTAVLDVLLAGSSRAERIAMLSA